MDGALDLSDVWERGQVVTAQMAAHQCLGKMLTDMGHASPERLIDRIYLGLHLDILTAKQAVHAMAVYIALFMAMAVYMALYMAIAVMLGYSECAITS